MDEANASESLQIKAPSQNSNFNVYRKLFCRVGEAKGISADKLNPNKSNECYALVHVDGHEQRTPPSTTLFWGEEMSFDELSEQFSSMTVSIWRKSPATASDIPLGQVTFPKNFIINGQLEVENWYVLGSYDSESTVTGEVRLKITYFPPKKDIKVHTFSVTVIGARHLISREANSKTNPFVVLHLLPDPKAKSTQQTRKIIGSLDPVFNDTFTFVTPTLHLNMEIHASVWTTSDITGQDLFLGHFNVNVGAMAKEVSINKWFALMPKPTHMDQNELRRASEADTGDSKAISITKPKAFLIALQRPTVPKHARRQHKFVDGKLFSGSYCGYCSSMLWALSTQKQCKECRLVCHTKCMKFVPENCGGVGMIRIKIKYKILGLLPFATYDRLLEVLSDGSFTMPQALGRHLQEREEIAKHLISIYESRALIQEFFHVIITQEVNQSADAQTLFRANSLTSKAIDVYMKLVGSAFLKDTLGSVIQSIISSKKPCEVDPSRLEKKDDMTNNWKNLQDHFCSIFEAIIKSKDEMPHELIFVFSRLQKAVKKRFPNDPVVPYTSVSGFVFLRFFAPAILGPKLFGLYDGYLDANVSRTLTLLAKFIQNLANFIEFGQKEPYMVNMNRLLIERQDDMKRYIDCISSLKSEDSLRVKKTNTRGASTDIRIDLAAICDSFVLNLPTVIEGATAEEKVQIPNLVKALKIVVQELENLDFLSESNQAGKNLITVNINQPANEMNEGDPNVAKRSSTLVSSCSDNVIGSLKMRQSLIASESPVLSRLDGVEKSRRRTVIQDADGKPNDSQKRMVSILFDEDESALRIPEFEAFSVDQMLDTLKESEPKLGKKSGENVPISSTPTIKPADPQDGKAQFSTPMRTPKAPKATFNAELLDQIQCENCEQEITDELIEAMGKFWHVPCFRCTVCDMQLETDYLPLDGLPYCRTDYMRCAGLICGICGEYIESDFLELNDLKYHVSCKKCGVCGESLDSGHFSTEDGSIICSKTNKAVTQICFACDQTIDGPMLIAMSRQRAFHPEHFNCHVCRKNLCDSTFHEYCEKPYCNVCWLQHLLDRKR